MTKKATKPATVKPLTAGEKARLFSVLQSIGFDTKQSAALRDAPEGIDEKTRKRINPDLVKRLPAFTAPKSPAPAARVVPPTPEKKTNGRKPAIAQAAPTVKPAVKKPAVPTESPVTIPIAGKREQKQQAQRAALLAGMNEALKVARTASASAAKSLKDAKAAKDLNDAYAIADTAWGSAFDAKEQCAALCYAADSISDTSTQRDAIAAAYQKELDAQQAAALSTLDQFAKLASTKDPSPFKLWSIAFRVQSQCVTVCDLLDMVSSLSGAGTVANRNGGRQHAA